VLPIVILLILSVAERLSPSRANLLHAFHSLVLGDFCHVVLIGSEEDSGLCGSAGGGGAGRSGVHVRGRPGVRGRGGLG